MDKEVKEPKAKVYTTDELFEEAQNELKDIWVICCLHNNIIFRKIVINIFSKD